MADFKEDANRTCIEAELCPGVIEKWIKFTNEGDETVKGNRKKSAFALDVKKHLSALGWVFSYTMKNGGRREMRYMSPQGKWFYSLVKACMSCVEDLRVRKDEVSCIPSNVNSGFGVENKRKSARVFGNRKLVKVNEEDVLYCPPRVRVCGNGGNGELVKVSCASRDRCSGFEGKKENKRVRACVNGRIRKLVKVNEEEDGVSCPPSDSDSDFEVKKERKRVRVCVNGGNRKLVRVNEEGMSCAPRDHCSGFESKKESKRIRVCDNGGSGKLSSAPKNLCSDSEVKKEKEKVRVCDNGGNQESIKVNEEKDGLSCAPRNMCSDSEVKKEKEKVRICGNGGNHELVNVNEGEDGLSCPPSNLSSGFNGVRI